MSDFDHLIATVQTRIQNIPSTFSRLSVYDYIRLVIIVGAYALLRPYLLKLAARAQQRGHERELDPDEVAASTKMSANSLRGNVHVPEDTDSESEDDSKKATDWGKKARRRQRKVIRNLLEDEEKRRKEEDDVESDKEIEEFLTG